MPTARIALLALAALVLTRPAAAQISALPGLQVGPLPAPAPNCSAVQRVTIPRVNAHPAFSTRGDTELGGRSNLLVTGTIRPGARRLFVMIALSLREDGGDHTTFERHVQAELPITPPTGCEVASVSTVSSEMRSNPTDWGQHGVRRVLGSGMFESGQCVLDTNGDDRAAVGCESISFVPIDVRFRAAPRDPVCGMVEVTPPPVQAFRDMGQLRGDAEMNGNRPIIDLRVTSSVFANGYRPDVSVRFEENGGDHTTLTTGGTTSALVWSNLDRPGCVVASVAPAAASMLGRTTRSNVTTPLEYTYGLHDDIEVTRIEPPIRKANCLSDTPGQDKGRVGCGRIDLGPVQIQLRRAQ